MSQIIRTEAVVLRAMAYRETSQIVTLFTREMGKIVALAKGARKLKSQFGATLQPMSHIQAIFYHKPTRDLQTLSETSHVTLFNRLNNDLGKMGTGLRMVELVNALVQVEEEQPDVFSLLATALANLNNADARMENIWPFFQLRLAGILGFQPDIERDLVQEVTDQGGWLSLDSGAIYPLDTAPARAQKASRTALRAYAILARAEFDDVMRMEMNVSTRQEVGDLVDRYLRFHFDEALPDRSEKVIVQMENRLGDGEVG